eukprot:TRINITY_DN17114_c0_g1_i1.p1 TRINITY_DN17114_c0_g1~~TRINITY_DN17114_c0_g1_i1.p1  ORF type:complete len:229 (-),score=58.29 TRINITY_DN17114_c0_g1_i1:193-879(-)
MEDVFRFIQSSENCFSIMKERGKVEQLMISTAVESQRKSSPPLVSGKNQIESLHSSLENLQAIRLNPFLGSQRGSESKTPSAQLKLVKRSFTENETHERDPPLEDDAFMPLPSSVSKKLDNLARDPLDEKSMQKTVISLVRKLSVQQENAPAFGRPVQFERNLVAKKKPGPPNLTSNVIRKIQQELEETRENFRKLSEKLNVVAKHLEKQKWQVPTSSLHPRNAHLSG